MLDLSNPLTPFIMFIGEKKRKYKSENDRHELKSQPQVHLIIYYQKTNSMMIMESFYKNH